MPGHDIAPTTHTPELQQVTALNERLSARSGNSDVTAAELGVAGASALPVVDGEPVPVAAPAGSPGAIRLPPTATLNHLFAEGPPDYPYIAGLFRTAGHGATGSAPPATPLATPLHTESLRRLSRRFGLRHIWGA